MLIGEFSRGDMTGRARTGSQVSGCVEVVAMRKGLLIVD